MITRTKINMQWYKVVLVLAVIIMSGCPSGSSVDGPAVVTGLSAEAGNQLAKIEWGQVEYADTYNIYYSTQPGVSTSSEKISGLTGSLYNHEGIINGTTYYYIMTAQNEHGESQPSNEVSATPILDAVTGLSVVAGNKSAELSWSEVIDAEAYNIYFSTDPGVSTSSEKISGITDLTYEHTGLINGVTYYYIVTAEDSGSESELSEEASAMPMFENDISDMLISPEIQEGDVFGFSIDIDGDYAIVGAPAEDGSSDLEPSAGAAYIFHRDNQGNWDQGIRLEAVDHQQNDMFGFSVSIHGSYAVVGAPGEDGGLGDSLSMAGAAYVFQRTGTNTWDSGKKLVAPDKQENDSFGRAVSIHSDYILVGAPGEDGSGTNIGAAYVFHRIGANSWDNGFKLEATDAEDNDNFGYSVGIDGDQLVVGAYLEDGDPSDPTLNTGAAYVFERTGVNSWNSGEKLDAPDPQESDWFGSSVSISGNRIVVGALMKDVEDSVIINGAGVAFLFEKTVDEIWEPITRFTAGASADDSNQFGYSVSIDGDFVVVGCHYEDIDTGSPIILAGAAYVFHESSAGVWEEVVKLTAGEDAQANDLFGMSVSVTENTIIVSSPGEDGGEGDPSVEAGVVYIF